MALTFAREVLIFAFHLRIFACHSKALLVSDSISVFLDIKTQSRRQACL